MMVIIIMVKIAVMVNIVVTVGNAIISVCNRAVIRSRVCVVCP